MILIKDIVCRDAKCFDFRIDEETGFLTVPVKVSRIGVQHYMGYELGLTGDRATERIGVFRPEESVFCPESVDSFVNIPVTDDHPKGSVTIDNIKDLQRGQLSSVDVNGNVLIGLVTITDNDLISKIKKGKIEVSVGYSQELVEEKGNFNGIAYDFIQTEIRANHLAIVDRGRCGDECKLTIDSQTQEKPMEKLIIDGVEFEVPTQTKQAFEKMLLNKNEMIDTLTAGINTLRGERDALHAKVDIAEKAKMTDDQLNKLVKDRASLLSTAKDILGDKTPDTFDVSAIKKAVILNAYPDMELNSKSDDYISAMFDAAKFEKKKEEEEEDEEGKKKKKSKDKLVDEFQQFDVGALADHREAAQTKYMKDFLKIGQETTC